MRILMICHRVPYPPNKGEKIRAFNILRHLAERHDVYLASLIDDSADLQSLNGLSGIVHRHVYDVISPVLKKAVSAPGLLVGRPVSVGYFYSRKLQREIDSILDDAGIAAVVCICSPTAEYLFKSRHGEGRLQGVKKVMDLIDVDSVKWREFAAKTIGPMKWVYGREASCLGRYERRVAAEFDHVLVVSQAEKRLLNGTAQAEKVLALENGVDLDYFSPIYPQAQRSSGPILVFTGVMDYWPNVDGVRWFAAEVFPAIRRRFPDVSFWIVGSRPTTQVRDLEKPENGIRVTGFVEDVRPYVAAADVCVAPLRLARGIQNKILEAMAMGRPVVCTPEALQGIDAADGHEVLTAGNAGAFSEAAVRLLTDTAFAKDLGLRARTHVEAHHSWAMNLQLLSDLLEPEPTRLPMLTAGDFAA